VRIRNVLGLVALVLVMPASQAAAQDYMPLKVGNKWTYKVEFSGQNLNITQKVTKIEKKGDVDVASIESDVMGMNIVEQTSSSAKGVFRYSFNGIPVDPPIQALKLPFKKGETWEAEVNIMGQKLKATMKAEGEEEVTVPAGKHKAILVSMEMDVMGQAVKAKSWFADKVGIVKQTFELGGVAGTSELEKVELAK
jgi:hypothetical protein